MAGKVLNIKVFSPLKKHSGLTGKYHAICHYSYNLPLKQLIGSIFILISCSDKENPIGIWDDNIKLSTKNVELTSKTDSVTIITEGDWWWIDNISFENRTYEYYGKDDINLESESYSILEEQFLVERRDKNTLFVKINKNNTGEKRIMNITFEAGDYFDYVNIKQTGN